MNADDEQETFARTRGWRRGGEFGLSFIRTVPRDKGMPDRVENGCYVTADVDWDKDGNIMGVSLLWGMSFDRGEVADLQSENERLRLELKTARGTIDRMDRVHREQIRQWAGQAGGSADERG